MSDFTVEALEAKFKELIEEDSFEWYELENYGNTIETVEIEGFGLAEGVTSHGGEGEGDQRWIVFKIGERYFRTTGFYSSWDGTEWYNDLAEVKPVEVKKIEYRNI